MALACAQSLWSIPSSAWWSAVIFTLAVVRLDAADGKDDSQAKNAPPAKFDWKKFNKEKDLEKESNSSKFDWDKFFQTVRNRSKDPPKKFEWDKLLHALGNRTKNETGHWKNDAAANEDWYKDLLLPEDGDDDSFFGKPSSCSRGYSAYRGGCYRVTEVPATFSKCQEICEAEGGSLATVHDDRLDAYLWNLVRFSDGTAQYGTWIGLYHDLDSQTYSGEWVDGSAVRYANGRDEQPLEGNLGCATVSCATMIPTCYWCEDDPGRPRFRGWDQIRCIREQHCLCEEGTMPSTSYLKSVSTLDWPEFLTWAQPMYFALGWPCMILLVWALVGTLMVTRRPRDHPQHDKYRNVVAKPEVGLLYGNLLDAKGEMDSVVHEWIVRGGYAAVSYGVVLLALAFTVSAQNSGMMVRIFINAFEALVMSVFKFAVGLSAFFVHRSLSHTSRAMAGPWVLILSMCKFAMSLGQLLMCFGYFRVALTYETCEALSLFTWTCMIGVVFQSLAGFSLFRVYYRTVRRVGDREVFSRVVGCWWSALVGSTFGVGIFLWWCGAEMLVDADSGLTEMPFLLVLTAFCQLTAGMSILRANAHIRAFFNSSEGKATFAELAERIQLDPSGSGELRTRVGRPIMDDFGG